MYRILLVDDNIFFRHTQCQILQGRFPQIVYHEANNGKKCPHIMLDVAPEGLFIDVHLHDGDGIALLCGIKKRYPSTILIVFSEYDLHEYQAAPHLVGINDIIPKELKTGGEIAALIETILVGHGFMALPQSRRGRAYR